MNESIPRKIWRVIGPILVHFVIYFAVIYGAAMIFSASKSAGDLDSFMGNHFAWITVVALLISFVVNYFSFRNDNVQQSGYLKQHPLHILWIFLIGVLMSHALSIFFSLLPLDNLIGSYQNVQDEIFGAGWIWAVIRAVIVTPVVEELVN